MAPREYGFDERFLMSNGRSANADVSDILWSSIPGTKSVTRAGESDDRMGIDWWVERTNERALSVDVKIRSKDYSAVNPKADDLALETWSVVEREIIGWTRDELKQCDFILWLWKDTGRWCLLPFPMLCRVFQELWQEWSATYRTERQKTTDRRTPYHSEVVFVPRRLIWREMYKKYGGVSAPT
jgi:hypothetical protein